MVYRETATGTIPKFYVLHDYFNVTAIIVFLTLTAWITVVQRMKFVYDQTNQRNGAPPIALPTEKTFWLRRRPRRGTRP